MEQHIITTRARYSSINGTYRITVLGEDRAPIVLIEEDEKNIGPSIQDAIESIVRSVTKNVLKNKSIDDIKWVHRTNDFGSPRYELITFTGVGNELFPEWKMIGDEDDFEKFCSMGTIRKAFASVGK